MMKSLMILALLVQTALAGSSFMKLRDLADVKYHLGRATDASGACKVRLSELPEGDLLAELHQLEKVYNMSVRVPVNTSVQVYGTNLMSYTASNGLTVQVSFVEHDIVQLRIERKDGSGVTCAGLK